jgi:hypothetical protein
VLHTHWISSWVNPISSISITSDLILIIYDWFNGQVKDIYLFLSFGYIMILHHLYEITFRQIIRPNSFRRIQCGHMEKSDHGSFYLCLRLMKSEEEA